MTKEIIKVMQELDKLGFKDITNVNFWQASYKGKKVTELDLEIIRYDNVGMVELRNIVTYNFETKVLEVN